MRFDLVVDRRGINKWIERVSNAEHAGLDTESSGPSLYKVDAKGKKKNGFLNLYRSTPTGYSVAVGDEAAYIPLNHLRGRNCPYGESLRLLRCVLAEPRYVWLHNLQHDLFVLRQLLGPASLQTWSSCNLHCTLLLAYLTSTRASPEFSKEGKPFGLKNLAKKLFNMDMLEFNQVAAGRSFSELNPLEALEYGAEDALAALRLSQVVHPKLKSWGMWSVYEEIERPLVWVLRSMQDKGVFVNTDKATRAYDQAMAKMEELDDEWFFRTGFGIRQTKARQSLFKDGIWSTEHSYRTKTGWSTDGDVYKKIIRETTAGSEGRILAELLRDYNQWDCNVARFTRTLITYAGQYPDGRIHPSFNQCVTRSFRLSSSNPNFQNLPSRSDIGKTVRECVEAEDGYLLVGADYSQIEPRIMADKVGGPLYDAYSQDKDVYIEAMGYVKGLDRRSDAKTVILGASYGFGAAKLADMLRCPEKTARQYLRDLNQNLGLTDYKESVCNRVRECGYAQTHYGHRRYFKLLGKGVTEERIFKKFGVNRRTVWEHPKAKKYLLDLWSEQRTAFNHEIQGSGAGMVKKSAVLWYQIHGTKHPLTIQVHDENNVETVDPKIAAESLEYVMKEAASWLSVPVKVEASTGKCWSELK